MSDEIVRVPIGTLREYEAQAVFNSGNVSIAADLFLPIVRQAMLAAAPQQEAQAEPFCWWRNARDCTDEYYTDYSDGPERPTGEGWKALYEQPSRDSRDAARITLTPPMLRAALEFIAPDNSVEQDDDKVVIGRLAEHEDGPGIYAWMADCPEEGSVRIDAALAAQKVKP